MLQIDVLSNQYCNYPPLAKQLAEASVAHYAYSPKHMRFTITVQSFLAIFQTDGGIPKQLLWSKQRRIDQDKVRSIIDYLESEDPNYRMVNQITTIATCNGCDAKAIDGQHRLDALCQYDPSMKFDIIYLDFEHEDQRFWAFRTINSNTPVPEYLKTAESIDQCYVGAAKHA